MGGCTPDEKHRDIPPPEVRVVDAYGLTLDETATPQQVAFVLLRSIADDVRAAQAHDKPRQKEALRTTHGLIAYATVEPRLVQAEKLVGAAKNDSLGEDRDQKLYDFARQLAPIVAHYVPSFDTDFAAADQKMRLVGNPDANVAHVYYDAAHDPLATDPERRDPVIIDIELAKESANGKSYWRVARVAFAGRPGAVTATRVSAPRVLQLPATAPGQ